MRRARRDLGDGPGRDLDARGNSRRTFVAELLELVVALQVDGDVLRLLLLLLGHGGFASDAPTEVTGRPRFFGGNREAKAARDFETVESGIRPL